MKNIFVAPKHYSTTLISKFFYSPYAILHFLFILQFQASGNVILKYQYLHPESLTFELVVENLGQEDVFLREIGAEYQIYYHTLWMGGGNLLTLKSSANYEIPIFIAPKCYKSEYLEKEDILLEDRYGIWNCSNFIKADPVLLIPAQQSVRLKVQAIPQAMKSYWEMEITLNLELVFNNETRLLTDSHLIFTEDIIAVLLSDKILNKEKILEMVNDSGHQGEFLNIRDRNLGKLEYQFDRFVAAHNLDKIGLTKDSMTWYLKKLLKDPDFRVQLAVFNLARKYKLEILVPDLNASWWKGIQSEILVHPYVVWPGILYTLTTFNQYHYIDSAFLEADKGTLPGEFVFMHLANHRDSIYFEKLGSYLSQYCNRPTGNEDNWEIRWMMNRLTSHLFFYELDERNMQLISGLLNSSQNDYIIQGLLSGLAGSLGKSQSHNDFIARFGEKYLELYHTNQNSMPDLLKLICYTSPPSEWLDMQIKEALISDDQGVRFSAFDLLAQKDEHKKLKNLSDPPLGRFIYHLENYDEKEADSIRYYLRMMVSDNHLSVSASNEIIALCYIYSDRYFELRDALPDSAEVFKDRLIDFISSDGYLNDIATIRDLLVYLNIFERFSQDSIFIEKVKMAMDTRLGRMDLSDVPLSELNYLAHSLTRYANFQVETPERKIGYYQKATLCFDVLLNTDSSENLKKSATDAYNSLAWNQLLNKQPKSAVLTCERGLAIQSRPILYTNLALGYLLDKQKKKALDLYSKLKDTPYLESGPYSGEPFRLVFLADLDQMEKEGLIEKSLQKDVEEIKIMLKGR